MSDDDRYRRFNLRIPKALYERLQADADARSHSMNAEIVQRLGASFEQRGPSSEEAFLRSQIESIDYQIHNMNEMVAGQTSDADNDADRMIRLTVMTHISILARQRAELEGRLIALHGAESD